MDSERWRKVEELYHSALEIPPSQRSGFLRESCGGDEALRNEINTLLAYQTKSEAFIELPAMEAAARILAHDPALKVDSKAVLTGGIDSRYRIVEKIGTGGMGDVYRAARADGEFKKEVAIKFVRGGFDTAFVLERFRNERQILATLDHPNIAHLLDGDTTDDGVPYLVMELVNGTPIDEYCDRHRLTVTQRLRLFRDVCSAVQYAHQRLVIHRDIKPGNILVTEEGVPKLLDFGIAKILDPAVGAEATVAYAMTPEYSSPEQIRGEPITTATDVYSLGVVLYHLLTGRSPYPQDTKSTHELARAICDRDPARPSTAFLKERSGCAEGESGRSAEEVAGAREGSPAKLRRRLHGDLDDITLMALRKEPSQRYGSVERFAEDIQNHLEGRPVTASKGSWNYRAGKFVARHRVGAFATAAIVLALAGGIGATVRQTRIARQQAVIAGRERARAEKRFNDVRELSDSLIFDVHDAIQNLPGSTPARKLLLDRAVQYLDRVAGDSDGDSGLQRELANGYQRLAVVQGNSAESNLGDQAGADASNQKAVALLEAVAKANPNNATDQLNVAVLYRIMSFSDLLRPSGRKNLDKAMAITDRVMKIDGANPRVWSERSIEYQNLGFMQDAAGDRAQALVSQQKGLDLKQDIQRVHPEYHNISSSVATGLVLVGDALAVVGSRREALEKMSAAVARYESTLQNGPNNNMQRYLAITKKKRGAIQLMNGDFAAALASVREARAMLVPMAKADPQDSMLQLDMMGLDYEEGRVLAAAGKYAAAVPLLQRAIEAFQDLHSRNQFPDFAAPALGSAYIWLGEAKAGEGDLHAALDHYAKASAALQTSPGEPVADDTKCALAISYIKMGDLLATLRRWQQAAAAYQRASDIVTPLISAQRQDLPAMYAATDAYAGMGDISALSARQTPNVKDRRRLLDDCRAWLDKSRSTWRSIPNPSRISPAGFKTRDFRSFTYNDVGADSNSFRCSSGVPATN
jgi:eukaryotic-like serine/threonine-protein kinase